MGTTGSEFPAPTTNKKFLLSNIFTSGPDMAIQRWLPFTKVRYFCQSNDVGLCHVPGARVRRPF